MNIFRTLFLAVSFFLSTFSHAFKCPDGDLGFAAGCLLVDESYEENVGQINLFYQVYSKFDSQKQTILFLNGGPGGELSQFTSLMPQLKQFHQKYNLIFFDPRGVGRSEKTFVEDKQRLKNFSTSNNIEDIERLASFFVGPGQLILFGHSYGAHLAYGYSVRYPQRVSKIISLNGATDEMGFILQAYEKQTRLDQAVAHIAQEDLLDLISTLQSGKGKNSRGDPLSFSDFFSGLFSYLTTFRGQTEDIPRVVKSLIEVNVRGLVAASVLEDVGSKGSITLSGIDPVVNPYIVCHDLLSEQKIQSLQDSKEREAALASKLAVCGQSQLRHQDRGFDVKAELASIRSSVLVVGGSHDPLVPIRVQKRDIDLLRAGNVSSWFLQMDQVGHDPLLEKPDCILPVIQQFLANDHIIHSDLKCTLNP
jgi:pimeloyl-ACP methyl ester carboxylesterase